MRASCRRAAALAVSTVALAGLAGPVTTVQAAPALPAFLASAGPAPAPAPAPETPAGLERPKEPAPFGSTCRTSVEGSQVVAYCHNPYPESDQVRLHTECDRWWDIDADGRPVEVGPAQTVRLTDRCWKEVRSAWVSHGRM
ncbi:hypothetical protein [Streptomyces sp. H27-C3]|uniref:hypothetical protein n=1 Tax=Streptomyces sp. H27-C3 TaxID=3046305 RepID=UPI0024BA177E|nr:hypothetical protein [Streptomyces sp. H27-C3]MDJ0461872.1 hypothetical protein [Streptomyces sp. H27-C3]